MKDNTVLIIDTNSNYGDAWKPCFGRLQKHFPNIKKYVFTDPTDYEFPEGFHPITYDNSESYRNQFLSCIEQVPEEFIFYSSEDYILYDDVEEAYAAKLVDFLERDPLLDFIKLIRGPENLNGLYTPFCPELFIIDPADSNFFAQQASIWRTRSFEKIFKASPPENTRMQHEPGGSAICRSLAIQGLQCYTGERKRGLFHYDSSIYPYIATAIVKGRWNVSEYEPELKKVFDEFGIDPSVRGCR